MKGVRRKRIPAILIQIPVLLLCASLACVNVKGIPELARSIEEAVDMFDRAIDQITRESQSWQVVLQQLEEQIVDDVQSTIRVEVNNLVRSTLHVSGAEFRCDVDYLRMRAVRELIRIRNELAQILNELGAGIPLLEEIPAEPHICAAVPAAVDLDIEPERRSQLELFGFDLRSEPIKVEVVESNGNRRDVTGALAIVSDQQMVLNLTDGGVAPDEESRRIELSWKGLAQSAIAVLSEVITCQTTRVTVSESEHDFTPPHIEGDADFHGAPGPCVKFWVQLHNYVQSVRAHYWMYARETGKGCGWKRKDYTLAEGDGSVTLFQVANPSQRVVGHNLSSYLPHEYFDDDHGHDVFDFAGAAPVWRLDFVGDTKGDEAGTETSVKMFFREMQVQVEQCQ